MNVKEAIARSVSLVRRGDFVRVATDRKLIAALKSVARRDNPVANYEYLTSRAVLAEAWDQTAQYGQAATLFKSEEVDAVLESLATRRNSYAVRPRKTQFSKSERHLVRAAAFYIIQDSVHHLRKFDLDIAARHLTECQKTLDSLTCDKCRFHSALSLLHYWQGRVHIAMNEPDVALNHFNVSIHETGKNLDFHFANKRPNIEKGDERIAYAVYAAASATAFGGAHIKHISGDLTQALDLLRPASAMLMGTADNYRRGYAKMLMGAAERALADESADLLKAIATLNESLKLFSGPANHGVPHRLHEARVHHQQAIAWLYLAQTREQQSTARRRDLKRANSHCASAWERLAHREFALFPDRELQYDLWITGSRILCEQRRYDDALSAADQALAIASEYRYAPAFSKSKAHVARAEVFLKQLDGRSNQADLLNRAEFEIREALKTCDNNLAMSAVAHLYEAKILAERGQLPGARHQMYEGWRIHEKQIQNRWVHRLAKRIESKVKESDAEFALNLDDLERELRRTQQTGGTSEAIWHSAIHRLKGFMIAWGNAHRLGIGETTYKENKKSFSEYYPKNKQ